MTLISEGGGIFLIGKVEGGAKKLSLICRGGLQNL